MINWEYVMSGMGYTYHYNYPKDIERVDELFRQRIGVKFSVLYNAFNEKKIGKALKGCKTNIYADSGGLQIVSIGETITEAMKDEIYRHQAEHSTHSMSFDEIPVGNFTTNNLSMADKSNKFFDHSMLAEQAKRTAVNINRQFEVFEEFPDRRCAPIAIIHGNCADSMLEWAQIMLEGVKPSNLKQIKTIAISGVSIGTGELQEFERAFVFNRLQKAFGIDHLHLLGVGAPGRAFPFAALPLAQNLDTEISYDSTSHSRSIYMGRYVGKGNIAYTMPKLMSPEWNMLHSDIEEFFGKDEAWASAEHILKTIYGTLANKTEEERYLVTKLKLAIPSVMAYNMSKLVKDAATDLETLFSSVPDHLKIPYREFVKVKTRKDFADFKLEFSGKMSNSPLKSKPPQLDDLFE